MPLIPGPRPLKNSLKSKLKKHTCKKKDHEMKQKDPFLATLDQHAANIFTPLHKSGIEFYRRQGLPGPKNEHWKYTNLNPLRTLNWTASDASTQAMVQTIPTGIPDIRADLLVLVNGRVRMDLSDFETMPSEVSIWSLAQTSQDSSNNTRLGGILSLDSMPLAALNTAHCLDGLVINLPPGVVMDRPFHIVSIGQGNPQSAVVFHPRIHVIIGDDAAVDIVESHVGDGMYFSNTVVEIELGARARCGHYKLQSESMEAFHVAAAGIELAKEASYDSFVLQIGGSLARNEVRPQLAGERGEVRLIGAYIARDKQHIDNSTFIDHAMPHCASREVYKGILDDSAHGVFQGKILVRPGAQKTDGYQLNRVLLLSDMAEINSKPELEIYADDVVCSHGATASQIDPDHLFYLQARGLDQPTARSLLVDSFIQEAVSEIKNAEIAAAFSGIVGQRLATPQ